MFALKCSKCCYYGHFINKGRPLPWELTDTSCYVGFFFRFSGTWVWMCVWPIRFTSRCLAQLFPAAWVPGCHRWALGSHLTHKWKSIWTWGCHSPWASIGIHSLWTCRGGFYKASGSGCCYHLHFQPPWLYPRPTKLTWRNVLQTLTEMSYEVSHLLIF